MVKYSSDASIKDIWIFGTFTYGLFLLVVSLIIGRKIKNNQNGENRKSFNIGCKCTLCQNKMKNIVNCSYLKSNSISTILILAFGWMVMFMIVIKIQSISIEESSSVVDPYETLGVEQTTSQFDIKKAFRKLSLKYHPDHGGDPVKYMDISNAYQILTDEESREKWERYGNLDGPIELKYGIALPIWLLSEKTPPTIIILYYVSVLVGIPTIVYLIWRWSFPSKPQLKDGESIVGLFFKFFRESSLIPIKRLVIIISICPMFNPDNSNRKKEHLFLFPSIKHLLTKMQITKEMMRPSPFNMTFSIEARALIWAQLYRFPIESSLLNNYQRKVLTNYRGILGMILHEFGTVWQYINYELQLQNQNSETNYSSRLNTMENCIKLCSCIVQGLQISDHNLLLLPHITNVDIARLQQKKKNVKNIFDYIKLTPKLRMILTNGLTDKQHQDIQQTLESLPFITISTRIRPDSDTKDLNIVTNSLFKVDLMFRRKSLNDIMNKNDQLGDESNKYLLQNSSISPLDNISNQNNLTKKVNKKTYKKKKIHKSTQTPITTNIDLDNNNNVAEDIYESNDIISDDFPSYNSIKLLNHKSHLKNSGNIEAHCPLFYSNISESWWIYITLDNDNIDIPSLYRTECIYDGYVCYMQVNAPSQPGIYSYTLNLVSDVYLGFHFTKKFNVEIVDEIPIDTHHHWDISSDSSDVDTSILTDEEVPLMNIDTKLS